MDPNIVAVQIVLHQQLTHNLDIEGKEVSDVVGPVVLGRRIREALDDGGSGKLV